MFFGGGHAIVVEAHAGIPIEKGLGPPENSIMQPTVTIARSAERSLCVGTSMGE
jgi:hypothetical protein